MQPFLYQCCRRLTFRQHFETLAPAHCSIRSCSWTFQEAWEVGICMPESTSLLAWAGSDWNCGGRVLTLEQFGWLLSDCVNTITWIFFTSSLYDYTCTYYAYCKEESFNVSKFSKRSSPYLFSVPIPDKRLASTTFVVQCLINTSFALPH